MQTSSTALRRAVALATLVLTLSFPCGPARGAEKTSPSQFIIHLKPAHPDAAASDSDKAKITQHFEYLKGLLAQGKLILAGLSTDDYAGIVIIEVQDRLEAERIMVSDPAVSAGVFLAELHPFQVAFTARGK